MLKNKALLRKSTDDAVIGSHRRIPPLISCDAVERRVNTDTSSLAPDDVAFILNNHDGKRE